MQAHLGWSHPTSKHLGMHIQVHGAALQLAPGWARCFPLASFLSPHVDKSMIIAALLAKKKKACLIALVVTEEHKRLHKYVNWDKIRSKYWLSNTYLWPLEKWTKERLARTTTALSGVYTSRPPSMHNSPASAWILLWKTIFCVYPNKNPDGADLSLHQGVKVCVARMYEISLCVHGTLHFWFWNFQHLPPFCNISNQQVLFKSYISSAT